MCGIGLGVVMEKHYEYNGRSVTGDELVSLAQSLTAEGQKAQTALAEMTDKYREAKAKCVKLDDELYKTRKKYFCVENELEWLRKRHSVQRFRIRCKTL